MTRAVILAAALTIMSAAPASADIQPDHPQGYTPMIQCNTRSCWYPAHAPRRGPAESRRA